MKLDTLPLPGEEFTKEIAKRLRSKYGKIDPKVVAKFCGNEPQTVSDWFGGYRNPAGGLTTLKLAYILKLLGSKSPELQVIQEERPFSAYLGELMAFDIIKMSEARAFAGGVGEGAVMRTIRGAALFRRQNTLRELAQFKEEHPDLEEYLQMAIQELKKDLGVATEEGAPVAEPEPAPESERTSEPEPIIEEPVATILTPEFTLAEVVSALIDQLGITPELLAEQVNGAMPQLPSVFSPDTVFAEPTPIAPALPPSDEPSVPEIRLALVMGVAKQLTEALPAALLAIHEFNDGERALLRTLTGTTIFDLSNATEGLSSARALHAQFEGK
ncbi:MAG: hypothetical protein ACQR33_01910 [Candidatus Saccharibacteria bacterium]